MVHTNRSRHVPGSAKSATAEVNLREALTLNPLIVRRGARQEGSSAGTPNLLHHGLHHHVLPSPIRPYPTWPSPAIRGIPEGVANRVCPIVVRGSEEDYQAGLPINPTVNHNLPTDQLP